MSRQRRRRTAEAHSPVRQGGRIAAQRARVFHRAGQRARKGEVLYKNGEPGNAALCGGRRRSSVSNARPGRGRRGPGGALQGSGSLIAEQSMFAGVPLQGHRHRACRPLSRRSRSRRSCSTGWLKSFRIWPSEAVRAVSKKLDATLSDLNLVQRQLSNFQRRQDRHVVGGLVPAAGVLDHIHARAGAIERRRHPDVVEAAPLVRGAPVARPVAPPGVELLLPGGICARTASCQPADAWTPDRCSTSTGV